MDDGKPLNSIAHPNLVTKMGAIKGYQPYQNWRMGRKMAKLSRSMRYVMKAYGVRPDGTLGIIQ